MVTAADSGSAHSSSQSVSKKLCNWPRILMGQHTRCSPGQGGVSGWKSRIGDGAAVKKLAFEISIFRTSALCDQLYNAKKYIAIGHGLTCQNPGFFLVIISANLAQKIHSGASAKSNSQSAIGNRAAVFGK